MKDVLQLCRRHWIKATGCLFITGSILILSQAFWIKGKAVFSQHLLQVSWTQAQKSGQSVKPWAWADVETVANLRIESLNESLVVLNDASGESMAFGPGLVAGNPEDAASSVVSIAGHRDTHLSFLEHIETGTILTLESLSGNSHQYRLLSKQTIDVRHETVYTATDRPGLLLITCYPFHAGQTGGPLRLLAFAEALPNS